MLLFLKIRGKNTLSEKIVDFNEKKVSPFREKYPPDKGWVNVHIMINKFTKEIHAIAGDREPGEGDRPYIGLELLKKWWTLL
jgi:hypothetical protein